MKNKRITDSFGRIAPDGPAKDRMLRGTLERYSSGKQTQVGEAMNRRQSRRRLAAAGASCLALALAAAVLLTGASGAFRLEGMGISAGASVNTAGCAAMLDFTLPNSDPGVSVGYTNELPAATVETSLAYLTEAEIYSNRFAMSDGHSLPIDAFAGTVKDIRRISVDFGYSGYGEKRHRNIEIWTVFFIEVKQTLQGDVKPGDVIPVLIAMPIGANAIYEVPESLSGLRIGDMGVFRPVKYDRSMVSTRNNMKLSLADIAPYGFPDGMRYAHPAQDEDDLARVIREVQAKLDKYN